HDRYFLDRVCNTVMEMDRGNVYIYKGNYQNYLEKREERIANYNAETEKVRNILRRELEWIHATPCARTGKAKYRIDAFHSLKERASQVYTQKQLDLSDVKENANARSATGTRVASGNRLGTKIIDCKEASFSYGPDVYLDKFTYNFQRGEKVGIVGRNGAGKTTFLNLLCRDWENWDPASDPEALFTGSIEKGESINIGYYRQEGMSFDEDQTVLETVNDTYLLGRFMFPHDMLSSKVRVLSGGEKRRLYLLTVLMKKPNVLILDEPTNDLDIVTLNVLEEYLKDFGGTLIIVSHDRHFLDRLVDHLLVFCGEGQVKDFVGNFSEYRAFIKDYEKEQKALAAVQSQQGNQSGSSAKPKTEAPRKLSWKEQRELESLEKELAVLAAEREELEKALSSGEMNASELTKASERIGEIISLTEEKEMRWLELSI
ncbi:MAG: ATP-binding cassette domain-containing protein, partial [Bacteroidales bacterium]|nr:ATP-binding cassette domain-containing protein [Bacteroidales bacterium]